MSLWIGIWMAVHAEAALGDKVGPEPVRGIRALFAKQPSFVRRLEEGPFVVCEWVSRGQVVGLEWIGPTPVPLPLVLGGYEASYVALQERTERTRGVRSSKVSSEAWVVERFGRMRALGGRAYLKQGLPRHFDWETFMTQCEAER
jgi:hypothetical protein